MDEEFRNQIRERAGERCEYCRISQRHFRMRFHLDRIIPGQHGGKYESENLALACHHCNRKKGPNLSGIDEVTGQITTLFNPRLDDWHVHFQFDEFLIMGITSVGRATVNVLGMNAPDRVKTRADLARYDT